ncbi:hypothetical protein ACN47E_002505 [Coniothyrium glycines]
MSSDKDQTSTLQSYVDAATGTLQSALGSLTGSTADKAQGENRKTTAAAERELSHSAAKAGPYTLSASGGVAKDSPDRSAGSWNQSVGAAKEALGGFVGAEGLKQEGIRQNQEGKAQEAAGQVDDFGKGVVDRVGGKVESVVAGAMGDEEGRVEALRRHDEGKARERGVEADLQKQVPQ